MIKLLVCEDEPLVRQSLVTILDMEDGLEVVGVAINGKEAVEQVAAHQPHVVLMDIRMPIMNGLEATRIIARSYPRTRVILLTTYDSDEYIRAGISAGAAGYVLKDADALDLVSIIERVHRGERLVSPAIAHRVPPKWAHAFSPIA